MAIELDYLRLAREGRLREIGECLWSQLESCHLCPRACGVNRLKGQKGVCSATADLELAGYMVHTGEEPCISGQRGSGTIFFSHCPLRCVFCQNYRFSQEGEGRVYSIEDLARIMLELQDMGVHNINLVTPEHYLPHIILALDKAVSMGLRLPLVYNTSSYVRREILALLEGVVDVYLPDTKFFYRHWSVKLARSKDYPEVARSALLEMYRQRPSVVFSSEGIMLKGVLIRHLVMPNDASGSFDWFKWIRTNLGKDVYISLMSQYYPFYRASDIPEISRRITRKEYRDVQEWMLSLGLEKGWWQEDYGLDELAGDRIRDEFRH